MDVDLPASLKRSSSAPMISDINTTMASATTSTSSPRESTPFNVFDSSSARTRRFSASFSPHSSVPRLTPRVNQLRQEECIDVVGREVAHEREIHSAMQMSQSWEDLTLVSGTLSCKSENDGNTKLDTKRFIQRVTDPLHVSLPSTMPLCSSPSPTRTGIRHFSPSLQTSWNLSPSPTRKAFATRRSLSPIALRPSSLGVVKRKFELEEDKESSYLSPPAKRPTCGGLAMLQRLSPLPGSLSSVGTPESLSSADSPGFFRPVDSPSSQQNAPSPSQSALPNVDDPMTDQHLTKQATTSAV
ncbi:hypothetical protein RUM44_007498 [Polyplax serrata]|uniref:Protein FAM122A n=1 Tax=Polyplax serrata TaxID=468196 RepID=A0ABR1B0U4_POLSC